MEPRPGEPALALPAGAREFAPRVERRITSLLDDEITRWSAVDAALAPPLAALRTLVAAGGKRLRPAFFRSAFIGAGGDEHDARVVDVAAGLELLHAFALVHDDVMDGSTRRRGQPAVHMQFVDAHTQLAQRGEARRFGEGAAILIGDFAFVYADMLFSAAPVEARPVFDELRLELCAGQFLDLAATAAGSRDRDRAELIERYKSGKYTVERPLHLGAALAGRFDELAEPLSAYGIPAGRAFQLRDDLLDVFGDPALTGRPLGDDLREGKVTPLLAAAVAADPGFGAELDRLTAAPLDDAALARVQASLVATGAVAEVEQAISALVDDALQALAHGPIRGEAEAELAGMARFVAWRDR
ncbi:MAG: geranylgeranyl diphosphate synthase, type [Actinomycetota bacterium]|nr:geranylgeranyl diphosphate synthase, type [Actinomycetota bacterium]